MARLRVGIDLSPIGFRSRAPGTAIHVENQVRALLAQPVEWDWLLVATPSSLINAPDFKSCQPVMASDAPLSYHVCFRLGGIWKRTGCCLGLATAFFCPFTGPPVVTNYFDSNALHPVRDYRTPVQKIKWHLLQTLYRFSRHRSRALFIDSDFSRRQMIEAEPATTDKWVVAPCGCPPVGSATATPPSWARVIDKHFILYVGAFSENKNQRRLIQAWDRLRRRHKSFPALVLPGPCPTDYRKEVIEPIRAKVINPNDVIIPGFISDEEVAWAFRNAYAYVQPSFAEGFGMPVVQAMSCGIPVACSNSTSLPEVANSAAIYFDPSQIDSIVPALETVVLDPDRRAKLKDLGLARAKLFSWGRHAEIVRTRIREELLSCSGQIHLQLSH